MWERVIEKLLGSTIKVIENQTAPRKRLSRAFVNVYKAVVECQKTYDAWKQTEAEDQRQAWSRAVFRLATCIDSVRVILGVHEPDLLEGLDQYADSETGELELDELARRQVRLLSNELQEKSPPDGNLTDDFDALTVHLGRFMRSKLKLKPEEMI